MEKKMIIWDEKEDNMFCGYIGEKTKMIDVYGEPIFVGDVVKITDKSSDCPEEDTYKSIAVYDLEENKSFIWGIECRCWKNGTITGWDVEKIVDFSNIEHSEVAKEVIIDRNFVIK